MKCSFNHLKEHIKKPQIISWLIISVTLLYVFLSVTLAYQDWMVVFYLLLVFPLVIGLKKILDQEKTFSKSYQFHPYESISVASGVILTYLLAHQLDISAVIASSFVGLLGYYLLRKYSVAIYCGSFAGMVSSFLFSYGEVFLIAVFCAFVFIISKPVMKGMGGKLGTTAFIATILVATFFSKDMIIVSNELNFIRLAIVSLAGGILTYGLQHYFKQTAVFSSALLSLLFALIMIYLVKDYVTCTVVFFSASFIGMSSKDRLPKFNAVIIASIIHAFLFHVYYVHYNGLGGKLGLMALTSVVMTLGIKNMIDFIHQKWVKRGLVAND